MKKIITTTVALFAFAYTNAQYTQEINTNRPSSSMGAYSVSKGIFQIEGGFSHHKDEYHNDKENTLNVVQLQFRYGELFEQLEFVADVNYNTFKQTDLNWNNNGSGFKNAVFGVKYLIYDHYKYYIEKRNVYSWKANQRFKWRRLIPAISLYAGGQFNLKKAIYYHDMPEIGLKTMLIAQQHISKRFSMTYNFIGENITDKDFTSYNYIITASLGLSEKFSVFGEHQGIFYKKYKSFDIPFEKESNIKGGVTYKIHQNLQMDLFAGTSLNNQPHKINGGLGLSWRNSKKLIFKDPTEFTEIH